MSWFSSALPSLANLFTNNPGLATSIIGSMGQKKAAATAVAAQLHSLSMIAATNPAGFQPSVQSVITAINSIPNVGKLNITDQVNNLLTAKDQGALMSQVSSIENAIAPALSSPSL